MATLLSWISLSWLWHWGRFLSMQVDHPLGRFLRHRIVVVVILSAGLLAYTASLALYWRTRMFADSETIRFLLVNSRMLVLYLAQAEGFVLVFLMVAAGAGMLLYLQRERCRTVRRDAVAPGGSAWIGVGVIFLLVDLLLVTSTLWPPIVLEHTDAWWTNSPGLDFELRSRSSPAVSLIAGALLPSDAAPDGVIPPASLRPITDRPPPATSIAKGKRRSVILIAIESLRRDVIGVSQGDDEIMPRLSELAQRGRWFTRAYSQSTHSDYADPCLVSSLYPLRSPQHHYYQASDPWPKTLIYDALKTAGYRTALFSSQNESWGNMAHFLESPSLDEFFDSRRHVDQSYWSDKDSGFARFVTGAKVAGKLDDAVTVGEAIRWLRNQADSSNPFFLYLNLQSSHFPYEIRTPHRPFQPCDIDFEASFASYPEEKVEVIRNAYFNALHYIDEQLGKLTDALAELSMLDDTLIVVAGDNGEAFYENGHPTHAGPPDEATIRVGLVFHCPALLSPAQETKIAQAIDIVPTILGMLEMPSWPGFQGIDLFDPLVASSGGRFALIHCESVLSKSEAVVSDIGWKYVFDRRTGEAALYLLDVDPGERTNLAETERDVANILSDVLRRWRRQQLLYYGRQQYYGFFYPPIAPRPSSAELIELERRARVLRARSAP
jgi:arylsulfatase A-like enzyme